jgi:glycosyltransferase involved in cell wall biosynthesis
LTVRVAITTDWLTSFGGAERVLEQLLKLYPEAPIYTSVYDPGNLPPSARSWTVRPSVLQRLRVPTRFSRGMLPLMARAFERFDLSAFDAVISVSSAFSKNVITSPRAKNLCYCLTPPRYLWDLANEYVKGSLTRTLLAPMTEWLRDADLAAADRVDEFVAISHTVADRVRRTYGREARVLYPPVDTARVLPAAGPPARYLLVVSRLVPYKRVDLAIAACNRLGRPLYVVGSGSERRRLERSAGRTIHFLGSRDDGDVARLFASAYALLFPGLEDFGITPVEAQAAGRPVVAFGRGGASETVIDGATGILFAEQTVDALCGAIERLDRLRVDPRACRENAMRFDAASFRTEIDAAVRSL